ncbi:MAG TPA: hypothetical protein VGV16_07180 [Gammaproteobacteria bacterium]|nr:hypothetical protein [Gammaproteobacteria bacterium]
MKSDSRSWCGPILLQALLILAGCAGTEPKPAPPALSLESCPVAAPLDAADLDAPHKTLESLMALGGLARGRLLSTQCAYENAGHRNTYLLVVGRQLKDELTDYLGRAAAWQQDYGRLDRRLLDYYQRCLGEPLDGPRFETCTKENAGLDAERQRLDAAAAPLQQRNQELTAAVIKYRADAQSSRLESDQTRQDYAQAMRDYSRWLVEAYALSVTPAVQPYAGKAGCPAVTEPPEAPQAMLTLGSGLLDCFRKIMGAPGADSLPGS